MAKWKLVRQTFGDEEYTLSEGDEVTVGRAMNNTITLSSLLVSRNHCVIKYHKNGLIMITDLKSSNGVFVGLKKIPQNTPYILNDLDIIGIGWTIGVSDPDIKDIDKYVFKLIKFDNMPSIMNRLQFQNENELDDIEEALAEFDNKPPSPIINSSSHGKSSSPILNNKLSLKRKLNTININEEKKLRTDNECIILLTDSETEESKNIENSNVKVKLEPIKEEILKEPKDQTKPMQDYLEFEAFNVKQEYLGYADDEPINIISDSDSESEHWYMRLSQSSPGKPFVKLGQETETRHEDSSYSQMDDCVHNLSLMDSESDEHYEDDLIRIPDHSHEDVCLNNDKPTIEALDPCPTVKEVSKDTVDGFNTELSMTHVERETEPVALDAQHNVVQKKTQMIEAFNHKNKIKTKLLQSETKKKSSKHKSGKNHSSHRHISHSQKEERKKRLKELASKEKESVDTLNENTNNAVKPTTNVKITTSNRGAFLTNAIQVVKPIKRKEEPKNKLKKPDTSPTSSKLKIESKESSIDNNENKRKEHKSPEAKKQHKTSNIKNEKIALDINNDFRDSRIPLKSLKPQGESIQKSTGKPISMVEPLPPKKHKKKVRFSENEPQVHVFEIEPGNKMKRTSLAKVNLVDSRQPVFSLEKITLMKILRWNPHWLEEQINNNDPPPILGHNRPPMAVFHSFVNHPQYVQLVGDLLLMEIWECLTLAHMKIRNQNCGLQMRIESLPPFPMQERSYELINLSVNVSMPSHDTKNLPRVGEIMVVEFGPENMKHSKFFYVHNVRYLPSPPNNRNSFFSISLHATYTDKMKCLRNGEAVIGRSLAYINKELNLFEAMEYLAGSPLSEAVLKPEARHFQRQHIDFNDDMKSQWNKNLNSSQQMAVSQSVNAALGDKPSIQMVQGPPGTGKSSVICAIVMTYFYNENGMRRQNRGKILICATSNAAVDELVIRLLNIRQSLVKSERFRMVRVGRAEAMAGRAREVSSQQLAARDRAAHAARADPAGPAGLDQEISHLEAKINMWRTAAQEAKDPVRVAYCQGRVNETLKRIALLRSGTGGASSEEVRPDQLIASEKRIIEGADIIVTTLSSALNHKMKGLKRRIALCIVDEAGQAIEPETLIPLTLDVTRLTLIGDPEQLPGYICSQRAKQHGLGESMFSRLASCGGCVLLDRQYRMQPDIADYPNRAFYGGRVRHHPPPRPRLPLPTYAILTVASGDKGQGVSGANEMEACGVSRLVLALASILRSRSLSLAVITPYNAHKDLIKKYLKALQNSDEPPVEVNTVDSFQGQERDVVVVSLARSQGVGFLTDAGRMNVMLTRARHALLVCLHPHAMLKNNQWRTLVEDAQRRKLCMMLPNKFCQPITSGPGSADEILKLLAP